MQERVTVVGYQVIPYLTGYYIVPLEKIEFYPDTRIRIEIRVINNSTEDVKVRMKIRVWEGHPVPRMRGPMLKEYDAGEQTIPIGETATFAVEHTTIARDEPRRDIEALLEYYDPRAKEWRSWPAQYWDDVYWVSPVRYEFIIERPVVTVVE